MIADKIKNARTNNMWFMNDNTNRNENRYTCILVKMVFESD